MCIEYQLPYKVRRRGFKKAGQDRKLEFSDRQLDIYDGGAGTDPRFECGNTGTSQAPKGQEYKHRIAENMEVWHGQALPLPTEKGACGVDSALPIFYFLGCKLLVHFWALLFARLDCTVKYQTLSMKLQTQSETIDCEFQGKVVSSPSGSGLELCPKSNLMHFKCHRKHLVGGAFVQLLASSKSMEHLPFPVNQHTQRKLRVLKITILPINTSKMGDLKPRILYCGRTFYDSTKFRGGVIDPLPFLPQRHSVEVY